MATTVIKTIKPAGGDYTSLAAWEAGEQRDLVTLNEIAVAECYAMSDTTRVLVDGWITDAAHYIRIYTPVTERHDGKWNTAKYRLEPPATWYNALDIREAYTEVDGLQIKRATASGTTNKADILLYSGATDCTIKNCVLTSDGVSTHGIDIGTSITHTYIYNTLIYDLSNQAIMGYSNAFIYNVTAVNCGAGISKTSGQSSTTWTCRNVLVSGSAGADFEILSGSGAVSYCASSDATADDWGGAGNRINQTFTFVDAANKDFHLAAADAGARDFGADLSADPNLAFSTDIDGQTRTAPWDIGADEYAAAGGGIISISGAAAGLGSLTGAASGVFSFSGASAGLSALTASGGLDISAGGGAAGTSALNASAGILYDCTGAFAGVSALSAPAAVVRTLGGSVPALSSASAAVGLGLGAAGGLAGLFSMSGAAGASRQAQGQAAGLSSFTGGLTVLSAGTVSGAASSLSSISGGLVTEYALGGTALTSLVLSGVLSGTRSIAGSLSAALSVTGSASLAGMYSGRGAPRFVHDSSASDSSSVVQHRGRRTTVTKHNNKTRVTR